MELEDAKQIIIEAKNIYLIASQEPEAIASTLALFYTLKEQGKNVNALIDELPESLKFLSPSLDFISYPKNFVVSVPKNVADISQIYYEKNDEGLKIHLTIDSGVIKKDNIAFYFSETKPDLIITIGIKDFSAELPTKLDSFGFLMESPIINIDSSPGNKKFGKINLVQERPTAETISELLQISNSESALCLLTSLVIATENFKNNPTAQTFQLASELMKKDVDLKQITNNLKI